MSWWSFATFLIDNFWLREKTCSEFVNFAHLVWSSIWIFSNILNNGMPQITPSIHFYVVPILWGRCLCFLLRFVISRQVCHVTHVTMRVQQLLFVNSPFFLNIWLSCKGWKSSTKSMLGRIKTTQFSHKVTFWKMIKLNLWTLLIAK